MKIKAILFDLDGTLLDTAPDFVVCVNTLRERHGLSPLAHNTIRNQVSNGARALTRLATGLEDNNPTFEPRYKELLDIYSGILGQHSTLFAGMPATLRWIEEAGLRWGIVTNKPSRFTIPLLERLSLPFTPSTVVCPDHVTRPKPDPEPMLLACQQCHCTPAEAIYFGDHARDIDAGLAAGMLTASCDWGYIGMDEDVDSWGANHRIASPSAIPELIKNFI
ncbi:MAG TPA: HAD-IA family hydrolase [Pseudomonadales bacterium]|nr:HAD-IA family hydrolase [Pseudomonadales bacterium]